MIEKDGGGEGEERERKEINVNLISLSDSLGSMVFTVQIT